MNILLIHQFFLEKEDPGGSRFNEMTKVWVADGHTVTVIAGMVNYVTGKMPEKYKGLRYQLSDYERGLTVMRCFVSADYNTNFIGRLWAYFSFVWFGFWASQFKIKKQQFDVIISTSPPLFVGLMAWLISILKRVPFVFEVRDLWPESAIETGVLKNKFIIRLSYWMESFIYQKSFLINVLTPAFRDRLIETKSINPAKLIFIPNAADFSLSDHCLNDFDANSFRKKMNWENKFVVTYVGAHGVANHLIQILDTAQEVNDSSILFVLIGDGMQKVELQKNANDRKLNNVQFINSIPKSEIFNYILASDAGLSILKKLDAFKTIYSNKTFDYMACKKPVLMAIDGVSRKLIEDAECGLYAEPENAQALNHQIKILRDNPQLCIQMGERGYTYAKNNFDRHFLAKKYLTEIETKLNDVQKVH